MVMSRSPRTATTPARGSMMNPSRSRNTLLALTAILLAFLLAPAVAFGAQPANPVADTCLMCHGDKDAKGSAGTPIAVDGERFAHSVHGQAQIKCTDCHADVNPQKLPHAEKLKPVACATCHAQEVKDYTSTVHGK